MTLRVLLRYCATYQKIDIEDFNGTIFSGVLSRDLPSSVLSRDVVRFWSENDSFVVKLEGYCYVPWRLS